AGAGLDAGTGAGRDQDDPAGAELADDAVRNRIALERDAFLPLDGFLGVLGRLIDGRRHFIGLAVADGDAALVVAVNDEGGEAEAATSLDHRGTAADLYHTVFQSVLRP